MENYCNSSIIETVGYCCVFISSALQYFVPSESITTSPGNVLNNPSGQHTGCRSVGRYHITMDGYRLDTCARCYCYLSESFVHRQARLWYNPHTFELMVPATQEIVFADLENISMVILETFASDVGIKKWKECCLSAIECCEEMLTAPPAPPNATMCPRTWDGWTCWPDTTNGTTVQAPCPLHASVLEDPPPCQRYASKTCLPSGQWYRTHSEWTNYTSCGEAEVNRRRLHFKIATHSVSVIFLIPAIVIFLCYEQLRVHRISMHKNFFVSLLMTAIAQVVFDSFVMMDEVVSDGDRITVMEANGVACRAIFILNKYFRLTSYMWMLCEGFYLHKLIAAAFAEQKNLIMFYTLGWVIPVGIYAVTRKLLADNNCWAIPYGVYEWIVNGPYLISLVLNFIFLCRIIWVLVTKLRATHSNEPAQYRKAVRATLFLVPLFGLHFTVTIYKPQMRSCVILDVYNYALYFLDGLQGYLVSMLFCYLNGEVHTLLKRSYQRLRWRWNLDNTRRNSHHSGSGVIAARLSVGNLDNPPEVSIKLDNAGDMERRRSTCMLM